MAITRTKKPAEPLKEKHIRIGKNGRYWVEIDRRRPDGSKFRKASAYTKLDKAIAARDKWLAMVEANESPQILTLDAWATDCFENILPHAHAGNKNGLKARTIHGYQLLYDLHASPVLGSKELKNVMPDHIMQLLNKRMAGKDDNTRANMRNTLSKLFTLAQAYEKVRVGHNPCKVVPVARGGRKYDQDGHEIHVARNLTLEEQEQFLAKARERESWAYLGFLVGFKMGLRSGEIIGFNLQNVDWSQKLYEVLGQAVRVVGDGVQYAHDLKKAGSYRIVPIPPSVMAELERFKGDFPFYKFPCTSDGKHFWRPESFGKEFAAIAKAAGLNTAKDSTGRPLKDPTPNDMRHSFGFLHANVLGTPHTALQKLMGHRQITTTLAYYATAGVDDVIAAMSKIA